MPTPLLIADPKFYALAYPAAVLIGLSKSGAAMGFGALAVPLLALAVPVPQAAAIMLPVLMAADVMGLTALVRHTNWALIRHLLPAGLLGIVAGALLFGVFPAAAVAAVVGAITLVFLGIRVFFPPRADAPPPPRWLGRVLGVVSGFTSFIAHAGSPPIGFYVLPMRLQPLVFSATMAVFFAAINLAKWLPYALLGLIDLRNMLTSLALLPAVPLGVWLGLRFVRQVSPVVFNRIFVTGMAATACKLLWDGWRGLS